MRPLITILAGWTLLITVNSSVAQDRTTADKLQTEINAAKTKLRKLQKAEKTVRDAHKKYRAWISLRVKQFRVANARQLAKLQSSLVLSRQLASAGTEVSVGVIYDRGGRIAGGTASVSVDTTERLIGGLLGKRVANKAFDQYAAWNRDIGKSYQKALAKAQAFQDADKKLRREINELRRWIKNAEEAVVATKELDRPPGPRHTLKLPSAVILALSFDKSMIHGAKDLKFIRDLSGWKNHPSSLGIKSVPGVVGDGVSLSFVSGKRIIETPIEQSKIHSLAMWIKVDDFREPLYLILGLNDGLGMNFRISDHSTARFRYGYGPANNYGAIDFKHGLTAKKWHHVALVIDHRQRWLSYFVDGKKSYSSGIPHRIIARNRLFYMGHPKYRFGATLDELVAFREPLTDAEVAAVYKLGKTGRSIAATPAELKSPEYERFRNRHALMGE